MFTHDVIVRTFGEQRFSDRQRILLGRGLVVAIVAVAYALSLVAPATIFTLGVWTFSGFSALFPLVFAALYWKRVTKAGAMTSILATAVTWVLLFRESGWGAQRDYLFLGMMPAATMVIISALTLVIVSLITRPPAPEVVERFFPRADTEGQVVETPQPAPVGA
jgi:SSS family solute:Na+ symporter